MHGAAGMRRLGPELGTDPMPGSIHIWMSLSVENAPPSPPRPTPPPPVSAELAARTHQSPHARGMTSCALAGLSKQGQGVFSEG